MAARGPGLRVRLRKITGQTHKSVLPQALYFQMGPLGEFAVDETGEHNEWRTAFSGEYSARSGSSAATSRSLRSTSFQTLTLDWDAPWLVDHDVSPAEMRETLNLLLRLRTPCELLVTRKLPEHGGSTHELLMNATLRSVTRTLRRGEADTRYYDLTFREWRRAQIGRRAARGTAPPSGSGASKNTNGRHRS